MGVRRRSFIIKLGVMGAAALAGRPLFAHAKLIRSAPKDGARLAETPKTLEFWFDERLEDEFNKVNLFEKKPATERKKKIPTGKPIVDASDRTHLILELDPLPRGEYVVEYRVLSRDSHTAPGRLHFSIAAR